MAILNKSSGSLFPLINDIKNSNSKNESPEPKLKRSAGPRSDVRIGDGMTVILSKIWGTLKKQEDFTKVAKKNIEVDKKFKKESKDLMRKNHQVILNSLNVLNKDVTKVLSKILDVGEKSAKEETKRLDEAERVDEIKQDFAKETFRESESDAERRHKELLNALGKISGVGDERTKRQKKSPFEKLISDLKKDASGFFEGVLAGVFGRSIASFLVKTLPGLLSTAVSSAIRLVLANPLAALAAAMLGLSAYMAKDFSDKEKALNKSAAKGDIKAMQEEAQRQADQINEQGGTGIGANDIIRDRLKKANTPEANAALKQLEQREKDDLEYRKYGPKSSSMIIQSVTGKVDNGSASQSFAPGQFSLPVDKGTLSSAMKKNRTIAGVTKDHNGVDIAVPYGSDVSPVADGKVVSIAQDAQSGKYIRVEHQGGLVSSYAHLSGINPNLKVGDVVTTSDKIGKSGGEGKDAGKSTGAHLHLAMKDASGQWVDPQKFIPELSGAAEKSQVAKNQAASTQMVASNDGIDSNQLNNTFGASTLMPDLSSKISSALSDAQSLIKGSASMFQDTGVKVSPVDKLTALDRSAREMVASSVNKGSQVNNTVVTNLASSGGGGSVNNKLPMTPFSFDSSLELAHRGMTRPVTGSRPV